MRGKALVAGLAHEVDARHRALALPDRPDHLSHNCRLVSSDSRQLAQLLLGPLVSLTVSPRAMSCLASSRPMPELTPVIKYTGMDTHEKEELSRDARR